MNVILLAAGRGKRLGARTRRLPKCLVPLGNRQTLLSRYLDSFRSLGLNQIFIVVGHRKEKIREACRRAGRSLKILFLVNPHYRKGSIVSLHRARHLLKKDCLIMDADVYFETAMLKRLLSSKKKTAFLCDTRVRPTGEEMLLFSKNGRLCGISKKTGPGLKITGETVGFLKISGADARTLKRLLEKLVRAGRTNDEYERAYDALMRKTRTGFERTTGFFWTEMDFAEDLAKIRSRLKP